MDGKSCYKYGSKMIKLVKDMIFNGTAAYRIESDWYLFESATAASGKTIVVMLQATWLIVFLFLMIPEMTVADCKGFWTKAEIDAGSTKSWIEWTLLKFNRMWMMELILCVFLRDHQSKLRDGSLSLAEMDKIKSMEPVNQAKAKGRFMHLDQDHHVVVG